MAVAPALTYDGAMRRGLFYVWMLVLVLRGLLGSAMAAPTVPPATGVTHASAAALQHSAAPPVAACHEARADTPTTDGCCAQHPPSADCASCGICHLTPLLPQGWPVPLHLPPSAVTAPTAVPFRSAPPTQALKPPIA